MNRRRFLSALAGAGIAAAPTPASPSGARPNVVIILSDDQGYGDIGCYGTEPDPLTPNLDRLAETGVRFTNFYANAPMCSPTRAALLTGRYPYRCGVPYVVSSAPGAVGLKGSETTLAEILHEAGYRTGLIGKWHLGSHPESLPNNQGFDYFYGFHSGCIDYYSHRFYWGLGAGLPSFHDLWRNGEEIDESGQYATELITRESKAFIRDNRERPFFLLVSYNAPHYPMHAPKKYLDRFPGLELERATHLALTAAMDDGVGEIMAALEEEGLRSNTFVFFQSDNGATIEERAGMGGRNTPWRGYKFSLFEGGIRMPAIANWKGVLPAGKVVDEMGSLMDLFPTAAKLCGARLPADRILDGKDVWEMIAAGGRSPHEALFWKRYDQLAVRKGKWKLVLNGILALGEEHRLQGRDKVFLSNLDDDPGETRNLAGRYPKIVAELQVLARQWELDVAGS